MRAFVNQPRDDFAENMMWSCPDVNALGEGNQSDDKIGYFKKIIQERL
jgi:hypothetical protein